MSIEKKNSAAGNSSTYRGRLRIPQSIDTSTTDSDGEPSPMLTSTTVTSTQSAQLNIPTPRGVRGKSDLRSPGARKSPAAQVATSIPDFITQTDRFGRATTPRTAEAITHSRRSHKPNDQTPFDEDQAVETVEGAENGDSILENLRLMCCCLLADVTYQGDDHKDVVSSPPAVTSDEEKHAGEPTQSRRKRNSGAKNKIQHSLVPCGRSLVDDDNEPIKLLPSIHPHDQGKKCLVLDLDETLVHSSFRAVTGADFVLPVQVRFVL